MQLPQKMYSAAVKSKCLVLVTWHWYLGTCPKNDVILFFRKGFVPKG